MFDDKYIKIITYSVTCSLENLEKYLDSSFRETLLKDLHVNSLKESHVHVDCVNNGITFSVIRGVK